MRLLLVTLLAAWCAAAAAQLRPIPANAQVGTIRHLEAMIVELDGQPQQLSPGAQIRDTDNRLVLPVSLRERETVRYLRQRRPCFPGVAAVRVGEGGAAATAVSLPEIRK